MNVFSDTTSMQIGNTERTRQADTQMKITYYRNCVFYRAIKFSFALICEKETTQVKSSGWMSNKFFFILIDYLDIPPRQIEKVIEHIYTL